MTPVHEGDGSATEGVDKEMGRATYFLMKETRYLFGTEEIGALEIDYLVRYAVDG